MVAYQNGKIYKIESSSDPTHQIYVGSTCQSLNDRLNGHRKNYRRWKAGNPNIHFCSAFELFDKFTIEGCQITLIENYSCKTKKELHTKEGEFISKLNCNNKRIAGRSNKQWTIDNKERDQKRRKEYREKNKEIRKLKNKEYRENPEVKEKRKQYREKYREENKEKLKQHNKEYSQRPEVKEKHRINQREYTKRKNQQ